MSKLKKIFNRCRQENRSAMIVFCSCGFPDLQTSQKIIEKAIEAGADIIELGIPFSDPMADGPVIQKASQIAIRAGADLNRILDMAESVSARHPETGFVLFSYANVMLNYGLDSLNVMLNYGLDSLCERLKRMGIDAVLPVDMPYEEKKEIDSHCRSHSLDMISLVSPATGNERIKMITQESQGFIYYVSMKGVTGNASRFSSDLEERIRFLRSTTDTPVAVGFGVSTPEDVRFMSGIADGFVIGSASLKILLDDGDDSIERKIDRFYQFLKSCSQASFRS